MKNFYMVNLKKAREKRGITQVRLSIELELAQETISGYEIGRISPSISVLIKIADFLNVSTDYLLGRIEEDIPFMKIKSNDMTDEESDLLFHFRNLNEENKKDLLWYMNALEQKENNK